MLSFSIMNQIATLQSLNRLGTQMAKARSMDQLLWLITESCTHFLQLEDLVIYTRHEQDDSLIQSAAYGEKCSTENSVINPLQIKMGQGIVGRSAMRREALNVEDTRLTNHYVVDDQVRLSELAVPIIWRNKVVGVIDSENSSKGFFNGFYVDVFGLIAQLCAPMMDHFQKREKKKAGIELSNKYYLQFIQLLERDKIYRDKHLSLDSVARQLDISTVYLSKIINQVGQQPFSTLINKYRIEEVQQLIRKGQHHHYNLLVLAHQAGFNSKSSFNYNFKFYTQQTPSDFIRSLEKEGLE
ncbi:MAG: helix-turn-helix domain-containing protein, partial [Bacteroidota bacterium]